MPILNGVSYPEDMEKATEKELKVIVGKERRKLENRIRNTCADLDGISALRYLSTLREIEP